MNLIVKEENDRTVIIDTRVKNVEIFITKKIFSSDIQNIFTLKQTHSDKFVSLERENDIFKFKNSEGDAIISLVKDVSIAVRTADCLPVFFYSDDGTLAGVCHAGWRGTAKKIVGKVADYVIKNLHYDKKQLNFIMGVAICNKCYEVKEDMTDAFLSEYGESGIKYFKHGKFDLKQANIDILIGKGIEKIKIFNLNKCTVCNNRDYFSFRAEKTDKRIYNVIRLR